MKKVNWKTKHTVGLLAFVLLGVLVYSFIWGKLFPHSPVIAGFERHELSRVIVYVQKGDRYTNFDWVDSIPR